MKWEDHPDIEWLTLEEAGLENTDYDTIPSSQWEGYYLDEDERRGYATPWDFFRVVHSYFRRACTDRAKY